MLTVILPTLNAADHLATTLTALRPISDRPERTTGWQSPISEVVVVDGGSEDGSPGIARAFGCRVVETEAGRGRQLAEGARHAHGAWFLFLHADTRLAQGWHSATESHLAAPDSDRVAAYFRFRLDDPGSAARRLERMVAWRNRLLALPYGDQGLLLSRRLYDSIGGFRPLPLMEDVDLVRRLGRRRLRALPAAAITSAERFRRDGYWRRSARNLLCLSLYFAGMPPRLIRTLY